MFPGVFGLSAVLGGGTAPRMEMLNLRRNSPETILGLETDSER
jgi:hypothetical protein